MKSDKQREVLAAAVEAYVSFVLHNVTGSGNKYPGKSADSVLMEYCPLYNENAYQTREYHQLFSAAVDLGEATVSAALLEQGRARICALEGCGNPIRSRAATTCSHTCGQEYKRRREARERAEMKEEREKRRAPYVGQAEALDLWRKGLTVSEIAELAVKPLYRVRQMLRAEGIEIPRGGGG